MRKIMLCTLVIALSLAVCRARPARAESPDGVKRLAVVSLAAYDELLSSVELAGRLSGRPKLAKGFQGALTVLTQGKGLAGLDVTRPWGIVVQTDGSGLGGYACLPVDDPASFLELIEPYAEQIEDVGDGVRKVQGKRPYEVAYLKHNGNRWLFVSNKREGLANTPDDPTEVLGGLHKQYDLAVRLSLGNLPAGERKKLFARIRQQAEKDLKQRPGEEEREHAIRKIVTASALATARTIVQDLDTVTLGWSLDEDSRGACLDMDVTAKAGSNTAQAFSQLTDAKTDFAGFRLPGAILTGHLTASCPFAGSGNLDRLFGAIRAKAFTQIDAKEPSEERAKVGKDVVDGLLEVVQETIASGRLDGATSFVPDAEGVTLVAGRHVADGGKLEKTFHQFAAAVRKEYPLQADQLLKTDVGELQGIRFHRVFLPVRPDAENRAQVVRLLGEPVDVVLGFGEKSVYLAAGRDAVQRLKEAIEASAADGPKEVPPMEVSVALVEVAKLVAETGQGAAKQRASTALAALDEAAGKDHVKLLATPVANGVRLRLELEQGVLRMIEAMHKE